MYVAARRLQFQRCIRQTAIILEPVLTEEHRLLMLLRTRLSDWEYNVLFIDSLNKNIFTIWKVHNTYILNMQLLLNREKITVENVWCRVQLTYFMRWSVV